MQKDTAIKEYAKKLVQLALADEQICNERVSAILQALKIKPPRTRVPLLKYFFLYLRREIRDSQIRIEYAGQLNKATVELLQTSLSKKYNRSLTAITEPNPKLIAGLRICISDDVYDSNVATHLAALRSATA